MSHSKWQVVNRAWSHLVNIVNGQQDLHLHTQTHFQTLEPRQFLSATDVTEPAKLDLPEGLDVGVSQIDVPLTQLPGGDFQVDSFFDVFYDLSIDVEDSDFTVDSFFDICYRVDKSVGGGDFNVDSFFDIFYELSIDNGGSTYVPDSFFDIFFELTGEPPSGPAFDSFFDVFFDVDDFRQLNNSGGLIEDVQGQSADHTTGVSRRRGDVKWNDINFTREMSQSVWDERDANRMDWLAWDPSISVKSFEYEDHNGRLRKMSVKQRLDLDQGGLDPTTQPTNVVDGDWMHIQIHGGDTSNRQLSVLVKQGDALKHGFFEETGEGWRSKHLSAQEASDVIYGEFRTDEVERADTIDFLSNLDQNWRRYGPVLPFGWEVERASPLNVNEKKLIINNGGKAEDPKNKMSLKGKIAPPAGPGGAADPYEVVIQVANTAEKGSGLATGRRTFEPIRLMDEGSANFFAANHELLHGILRQMNREGSPFLFDENGTIDGTMDLETGEFTITFQAGDYTVSIKHKNRAITIWDYERAREPGFLDGRIHELISATLSDLTQGLNNPDRPYQIQSFDYASQQHATREGDPTNPDDEGSESFKVSSHFRTFDGQYFHYQGVGQFMISGMEHTQSGDDEAEDSIVVDYGAVTIEYQRSNTQGSTLDLEASFETGFVQLLDIDNPDEVAATTQYHGFEVDWQAVDSTGQEVSDDAYQLGPAALLEHAALSGNIYEVEIKDTHSHLKRQLPTSGDGFVTTGQLEDIRGEFSTNLGSSTGGGAGAGKVKYDRLSVKKYTDKATTDLLVILSSKAGNQTDVDMLNTATYYMNVNNDRRIPDSFFDIFYDLGEFRQKTEDGVAKLKYSAHRGTSTHFIDDWQGETPSTTDEPPTEEFGINFEGISMGYVLRDQQGRTRLNASSTNYGYRGPKAKIARRFTEPVFGPSKALQKSSRPRRSNIVVVNIYDGGMHEMAAQNAGQGTAAYDWSNERISTSNIEYGTSEIGTLRHTASKMDAVEFDLGAVDPSFIWRQGHSETTINSSDDDGDRLSYAYSWYVSAEYTVQRGKRKYPIKYDFQHDSEFEFYRPNFYEQRPWKQKNLKRAKGLF